MREPILKAVAEPYRLFWAPAAVAGLNMIVQFALMFMWLGLTQRSIMPFIITIPVVHMFIAAWGKKEPHLSNILVSWGRSGATSTKNIYRSRGTKFSP